MRKQSLSGPIAIVPAPGQDPPSKGVSGPDFVEQVAELVNQERWDNGQLPPLKLNALLNDAAGTHSTNMAERDFFAHCDLDNGDLPWDRMRDAGYNWSSAAENIAAGYSTPASVMAAWMQSSGTQEQHPVDRQSRAWCWLLLPKRRRGQHPARHERRLCC